MRPAARLAGLSPRRRALLAAGTPGPGQCQALQSLGRG